MKVEKLSPLVERYGVVIEEFVLKREEVADVVVSGTG